MNYEKRTNEIEIRRKKEVNESNGVFGKKFKKKKLMNPQPDQSERIK